MEKKESKRILEGFRNPEAYMRKEFVNLKDVKPIRVKGLRSLDTGRVYP